MDKFHKPSDSSGLCHRRNFKRVFTEFCLEEAKILTIPSVNIAKIFTAFAFLTMSNQLRFYTDLS
jgi:hypothetical protein